MQKYGREIPAKSQLCFNHGIHLAVLDVFYEKNELYSPYELELASENSNDVLNEMKDENDGYDEERFDNGNSNLNIDNDTDDNMIYKTNIGKIFYAILYVFFFLFNYISFESQGLLRNSKNQ